MSKSDTYNKPNVTKPVRTRTCTAQNRRAINKSFPGASCASRANGGGGMELSQRSCPSMRVFWLWVALDNNEATSGTCIQESREPEKLPGLYFNFSGVKDTAANRMLMVWQQNAFSRAIQPVKGFHRPGKHGTKSRLSALATCSAWAVYTCSLNIDCTSHQSFHSRHRGIHGPYSPLT